MHTIRKLAREIDRRSVWQVLAGYVVLSWLAYEVVDRLTALLGLPLWTPDMAFVLLAIGLPIVTATAAVQGGIPWLRIVDEVDPNELEGLTPDQVHVVPHEHPLHGVQLFTWRNAILGGVMAAALLVTSVVAYLSMWALGIGPVGSLHAQGIIDEGDLVVVADVGGSLMDAEITESLTRALRSDLGRSSLVDVLDAARLREALLRMGRAEGDPVSGALAVDLATREGARAVVDSDVTYDGDRYRIRARLVLVDGTPLARFEDSAGDLAQLERSVLLLSARLRERMGEPMRSIRTARDAPRDPTD